MKHICYIIICLLFVSCKQSIFLQRKYTDGFYFSKAGSIHLKEIHQVKTKVTAPAFSEQADVVIVSSEPLTDTIILNSGRKVPCKVKTIQRKRITFTDGTPGPTGGDKSIRSKNIARIHFNEGQKEYFTQRDQNGNPILQFDFIRTGKRPRIGLAIFGYILIMLASFGIISVAPFLGFFVLALSLASLVFLNTPNYESLAHKIVRGLGKFFGIIFFVGLGVILLALIILLATF